MRLLTQEQLLEVAKEMLRLREQGDSDIQIATQYRCTPNTVRNRIKLLRREG